MIESPYHHIRVRPLAGALGAEILGVDIAAGLEPAQLEEVRRTFREYGVVFFRGQRLTPEQHVAFARLWGDINVNRFFHSLDGYPMIAEVRKDPGHEHNIGGSWHADHSYDEIPALGSMLYALEVPHTGGDTLFASMYFAHESLSPGMKRLLAGLRARHSSRHVFGAHRYADTDDYAGRVGNAGLAVQDVVHPVVVSHPETGRKALYVNPGFTVGIDGWTGAESAALLDYLYRHAVRPEFTCRFRWEAGSLAFWDNRCTWHYALNDYPGQRRYMHRVTIEGSPLAV